MVSKRSENHLEVRLEHAFEMPFSLLTRSGSVAIILALQATRVLVGSKVVVPASCCPVVMYSLTIAGYQVVLADVSLETLNCDVSNIKKVTDKSVKAIIAVHAYGRVCDINNITKFAKENNIVVVEDACLAYGAHFGGAPIGGIADISVISFGYDKPIAHGAGGALLTKDPEVALQAQKFMEKNEFFAITCDEQELVAIEQKLKRLPESTCKRVDNVKQIHDRIHNPLFSKLPMPYDINYWRYPLLLAPELRQKFLDFAKQREQVFTCHYRSLGEQLTFSDLPNADYIGKSIVNLFVRPETSQQEIQMMIQVANEFSYDT